MPTEKLLCLLRKTECDGKKEFYVLDGVNQRSPELILGILSRPSNLLMDQQLQIWHGQDWADCSEHNNNDTSCVGIFAWYVWEWQGSTIINVNKKCAAHWHLRLPFTLFSRLYLNSRKWKVFYYSHITTYQPMAITDNKLELVFNMAVSLFFKDIIQHEMLILKRWKRAFICSWWNETVL